MSDYYILVLNLQVYFSVAILFVKLLPFYNQLGIKNTDIVWIDAILSKVVEAANKGVPNVYNAVITDKDDEDIVFNISNNLIINI